MALIPLNSEGGFSVGSDEITTIVTASGNVNPVNLTVSGESNLGSVANVIITGGTNGQLLYTDGSGNLGWKSITSNIVVGTRTGSMTVELENGILTIVGRSGNIPVPVGG